MAAPIAPYVLTSPGFYGLNTQSSPTDMDPRFALSAMNCVIDKSGRIASRKGWVPTHTVNATLGTATVEAIGELCDLAGNRTTLCAGANKLFKISGTTLVELTYGGPATTPTIASGDWQIASLNNALVFFQLGHDPLVFDTDLSTTTYRRLSEHPSASGTAPLANCCISAFGRLWAARTVADKSTVYWTDTATHQKWTGGTAGTLSLAGVWPRGTDEVVALASHNNFLFIFGRTQILIYSGANNPATMSLSDSIVNTGCVARDSVVSTGEDIIFLSDSGVRSVLRTIQEKSAPMRSISVNVNDDILAYTGAVDTSAAKAAYSPRDTVYVLSLRNSGTTYCFDTRTALEDGALRVTQWSGITPWCLFVNRARDLLMGQPGYIGKYSGTSDNGATYRMVYYTGWLDLGSPIKISILKRMIFTLIGSPNQALVIKWAFDYDSSYRSQMVTLSQGSIAQYAISEYGLAEYGVGAFSNVISVTPGGSGKVFQLGFEMDISSTAMALQRVEVFSKEGRY